MQIAFKVNNASTFAITELNR